VIGKQFGTEVFYKLWNGAHFFFIDLRVLLFVVLDHQMEGYDISLSFEGNGRMVMDLDFSDTFKCLVIGICTHNLASCTFIYYTQNCIQVSL